MVAENRTRWQSAGLCSNKLDISAEAHVQHFLCRPRPARQSAPAQAQRAAPQMTITRPACPRPLRPGKRPLPLTGCPQSAKPKRPVCVRPAGSVFDTRMASSRVGQHQRLASPCRKRSFPECGRPNAAVFGSGLRLAHGASFLPRQQCWTAKPEWGRVLPNQIFNSFLKSLGTVPVL